MMQSDDILTDANDNTASIEYFGSREAAQKALDSLVDCKDCRNCSDCYGCYGCYGCSRCSDCSDCYGCYGCYGCSRCSDCYGCYGCSHIAVLYDRKGLQGDPDAAAYGGPPLVPQITDIHARVLEAVSHPGALNMSRWHTCGTTHCRAGWVVHLAGEAGYALERFHNTALAAQLIYRESDPQRPVSPVRFFETNEQALADIRRCAEIAA